MIADSVLDRIKGMCNDGKAIREFLVDQPPMLTFAPSDMCGCFFYGFLSSEMPTLDFHIGMFTCAVTDDKRVGYSERSIISFDRDSIYQRFQDALIVASEGSKRVNWDGEAMITVKKALKVFDETTKREFA